MSSIHIPPIPSIKMVTQEGYPTVEEAIWRQQELQSRSPWTPYMPTITNLSAITVNDCAYSQMGKVTHVRIALTGTTNGSSLNVTLPFKARSQNQTFAVEFQGNTAGVTAMFADLITLGVAKYDATTPANGVVLAVVISGVYEAQ